MIKFVINNPAIVVNTDIEYTANACHTLFFAFMKINCSKNIWLRHKNSMWRTYIRKLEDAIYFLYLFDNWHFILDAIMKIVLIPDIIDIMYE